MLCGQNSQILNSLFVTSHMFTLNGSYVISQSKIILEIMLFSLINTNGMKQSSILRTLSIKFVLRKALSRLNQQVLAKTRKL